MIFKNMNRSKENETSPEKEKRQWPDFRRAQSADVFAQLGVAGELGVVLVEQFGVDGGHGHENRRPVLGRHADAQQFRPDGAGVKFRHHDAPARSNQVKTFVEFGATPFK